MNGLILCNVFSVWTPGRAAATKAVAIYSNGYPNKQKKTSDHIGYVLTYGLELNAYMQ